MFHKDTFRLIKKTRKRFITIFLIVAIGVSFMVGLMSSEPTMRVSVDKYYDDTDFMDIQLFSSYGFGDEDISVLKNAKDVESVFGTKFVDTFYDGGEGAIVVRVQEIDCDMNRFTLTEGRMPSAPDEALALGSSSFGSVFRVGDVAKLYLEDDDLKESLAVTEYKIVGIVKTPQYMASSRETSTLDNLSLSTVIYTQNNNFLADYFTSVYLTFENSRDYVSFSEEYKSFVEDRVTSLEKVIKKQEVVRRDEIIEEVKAEIADGEKELDEEIAKAQKEIDDGRKKLEEAYIQLVVGETQIKTSEEQLAAGEREIAVNQRLMADSEKKLNDGKAEIVKQTGAATYEEAAQQIEAAYTALSMYSVMLENIDDKYMDMTPGEAISHIRSETEPLEQANTDSRAAIAAAGINRAASEVKVNAAKAEIERINSDETITDKETAIKAQEEIIAAEETNIARQQKIIDDENAAITQREGEISALEAQANMLYPLTTQADYKDKPLKEIKTDIDIQLNGDVGKAHKAVSDIASGEVQLSIGKQQLESGKAELESGKKQLAEAKVQVANGRREYEKGLKELEDGQKELNEEKEKAEIELAKARQELEDLPEAGWTVLDRDMHYSTYMFDNNATQMGKIGYVFPLLFFLVAALVCMTTMKRLVDEERGQIGVFSALGFSKMQIISKYVIYAFSASILGSLIAIPIGMGLYPVVIYFCWRLMYDLPDMVLSMPAEIAAMGVCSFTLIMIAVTVTVTEGVLKGNPSMLMRPKAPKNAKKVFLEKIDFIWTRLSFTSKVTARNIIRYKSRFFMTVIGVAGCTSLLVLGFAIKDSISQVVSIQYNDIITYDTTAVMTDKDHTDKMLKDFKADSRVEYAVPLLSYSSRTIAESGEGTISVYVVDDERTDDIFNLRDRKTKEPIHLKNGVVVSEKFSVLHDVEIGDKITIESANGIKRDVEIANICEMYAGHYLFISRFDYEDFFGETAHFDTIALTTTDSRRVIKDYENKEEIKNIADFTAMKATFNNMFDSLNIIIIVITIAAGSLALVVIMNLTEVNISERIREIATLKVLGFNNKEVYSYIFKEVFILSLIGIVFGLPLGRLELMFVMSIIDMEMVMFPTIVKPFSYFASFCITLVFTVLVTLLMRKTLRNVQMVESLKSVE